MSKVTIQERTSNARSRILFAPSINPPLSRIGDFYIAQIARPTTRQFRAYQVLLDDASSVFQNEGLSWSNALWRGKRLWRIGGQYSGTETTISAVWRFLSEAPVPGTRTDFVSEILASNPDARILVLGCGERRYYGDVTYTDVAFAA